MKKNEKAKVERKKIEKIKQKNTHTKKKNRG